MHFCQLCICAQNEQNKTKSSSPASIMLLGLSFGAGTSKRTIIVKMWVRVKVEYDKNAIWHGSGLANLRAKRKQGTVRIRPPPH